MKAHLALPTSFIVSVCFINPLAAQTIVKDHVSNAAAWADEVGGVLDNFLDPQPAKSAVFGIAITGNGERLAKVGIIFGHGDADGIPNQGDIHEFRWRFRFFADTADFSLAAMNSAPPQPNYAAVFDAPSNSDWTTVIGSFLGIFDLRYAEVDVSSLGITTVPSQTHLVVLVPESRLVEPATIGAIAMSGGGAGTVGIVPDWYERGASLGAEGPGSLNSLGENWSFVASKVTTTPSPTCAPPTAATADRLVTCIGSAVQLSGQAGSGGDSLDWFSGSCGGATVGSGLTLIVNPLTDTTYFARTRNSSNGCINETCLLVGPVHVHAYAPADLDQDCDVDGQDVLQMAGYPADSLRTGFAFRFRQAHSQIAIGDVLDGQICEITGVERRIQTEKPCGFKLFVGRVQHRSEARDRWGGIASGIHVGDNQLLFGPSGAFTQHAGFVSRVFPDRADMLQPMCPRLVRAGKVSVEPLERLARQFIGRGGPGSYNER